MKCIICGNEKSIFSVLGLEGSICRRCNEHLNMYTYENPAVAKAYFDKVAENNELTSDTKRFLELKYREHQNEISEFDVENAKKKISLEMPPDPPAENTFNEVKNLDDKAEQNVPPKSSSFRLNPESDLHHIDSHDCSLEYKAFHRELANIEKKLEDQYNSVRTIKNILIFFAIITGVGLICTIIYVAQLVSVLNKVF